MSRVTPSRRDTGLSLLELVVALAVFALMATLSLQALSGTLRARDRLATLDDQTTEITAALSILRADLRAAVPLIFYPPGHAVGRSAVEISPAQDRLGLSVNHPHGLPGQTGAGLGRVIWRFDAPRGQLIRTSWPVLIPANPRAQAPEVVVTRAITAMQIRTLRPNLTWRTGPDPEIRGSSAALPLAIEVTLTHQRLGQLTTLVSHP